MKRRGHMRRIKKGREKQENGRNDGASEGERKGVSLSDLVHCTYW